MRTFTIEKTVYKFDELSEKAQDHALDKLSEWAAQDEWWDSTYDDAERACIKITSFDCYYQQIDGELIDSAASSIAAILKDHGESCETYKTAKEFEAKLLAATCKQCENGNEEDCESDCEAKREEVEDEYRRAILEDYLVMLREEYEYRTSREALLEDIKANEWEFDERGNLA